VGASRETGIWFGVQAAYLTVYAKDVVICLFLWGASRDGGCAGVFVSVFLVTVGSISNRKKAKKKRQTGGKSIKKLSAGICLFCDDLGYSYPGRSVHGLACRWLCCLSGCLYFIWLAARCPSVYLCVLLFQF
jgi:hypothetical protein